MIFLAKTIHEVKSPLSGLIRVIEEGSERRLVVAGFTQSKWNFVKGGKALDNTVWSGFLKAPFLLGEHPKVLILGFGGGTVAKLLMEKYGTIPITGVDIDQEMLKIAGDFFAVWGVELICQDAIDFVRDQRIGGAKFDFIIIDLERGDAFPPQAETEEFLTNARALLNNSGVAVANRIFIRSRKEQVQSFLSLFKKKFPRVGSVVIPGKGGSDNILLFGQI